MEERSLLDRIRQGMEVRDSDGEKLGTVGKVRRPVGTGAAVEAGATRAGANAEPMLEITSGILGAIGIGRGLFVPLSRVREVTDEAVLLDVDRATVQQMGWNQ